VARSINEIDAFIITEKSVHKPVLWVSI